jgi:hypothetical protein
VARALASPFFASPDVKVYLHYDARRSAAERDALAGALPPGLQHAFVAERVACGWGDYSLVEATHRLLRAATEDAGYQADHLVLLSASCVPIRPLASLQEFLRRRDGIDFIQAVDVTRRSWVKGGLEKERFELRFPFNFKTHRRLFESFTALQRRLGIRRRPPDGLRIHFGSQWFCLTRSTAVAVTARLADRGLRAFFAASWIPDEFAIQSLVMSVQRPERVAGHNLTYYEFDDQGRPLVLENGHFDHLLRQPSSSRASCRRTRCAWPSRSIDTCHAGARPELLRAGRHADQPLPALPGAGAERRCGAVKVAPPPTRGAA